MKNLVIGSVVFVIWTLFAIWLYFFMIEPAFSEQVAAPEPVIEEPAVVVDTVVQPEVTVPAPEDLLIQFGFDKAVFDPDASIENGVDAFKKWLEANPESVLLITGHTCSIGSDEYNLKLGMRRAGAVKDYFVSKGFNTGDLKAESVGESQPAADQSTAEGRAKNRRVVVTINQ